MASNAATKRFMLETHFGGFEFLAKSLSGKQRAFWASVLAVCSVGLTAEIIRVLSDWASAPPSTMYVVEPQMELQLPDYVICIPSRFDQQKIANFNVSKNLADFLQRGFLTSSPFIGNYQEGTSPLVDVDDETISEYHKLLTEHNITYQGLVEALRFEPSDIIRHCVLNGSPRPECAKKARRLWLWPGLCFEVKTHKQVVATPLTGVKVNITVPIDRHVPGPGLGVPGGAVTLLSVNDHVEPMGTLHPLNSVNHISLALTQTEALPSDAVQCRKDSQQPIYSCAHDCAEKVAARMCNCAFVDAKSTASGEQCRSMKNGGVSAQPTTTDAPVCQAQTNLPICTPMDVVNCFKGTETNNMGIWEAIGQCTKDECRHSCIRHHYRRTESYHLADSDVLSNSSGRWSRNMIHVTLYYESLEIVKIKQYYPMSVTDFLGIVGGLLGLWLGGSIIATVHLMAFCLASAKTAAHARSQVGGEPPPAQQAAEGEKPVKLNGEQNKRKTSKPPKPT